MSTVVSQPSAPPTPGKGAPLLKLVGIKKWFKLTRGIVFQKKLLLNRENDLPLFGPAQALAEGTWSEPVEVWVLRAARRR